jgi:uncharacterized lipoprotein YmbA
MTMRSWLAVVLLAGASGCSLLTPEPDPSRFFVLTAMNAAPAPPREHGDLIVGVGPINIPGYLDRNEIATRVSSDELHYSPVERWAEPLRGGIERTIAENLMPVVPGGLVLRFPWAATTRVDYQVGLDVRRFEADKDGNANLFVRWTIRSLPSGRFLVNRESSLQAAGGSADPELATRALSTTLAQLSQEIAAEIMRLGPPEHDARPRARR